MWPVPDYLSNSTYLGPNFYSRKTQEYNFKYVKKALEAEGTTSAKATAGDIMGVFQEKQVSKNSE